MADRPISAHEFKIMEIFKANCVHFNGNYEVTPEQALRIEHEVANATNMRLHDEPIASRKELTRLHTGCELEREMWNERRRYDNGLRAERNEALHRAREYKDMIVTMGAALAEIASGCGGASSGELQIIAAQAYEVMP
jgi:hypothetical protein